MLPILATALALTTSPLQEEIIQIPKIDLHLHLGGSFPLDYIEEIASPEEYKAICEELKRIHKQVDYSDCFHIFTLVAQVVNTDEKIEEGAFRLAKQQAEDGVALCEVRTGLKDLGSGIEGYLQAVLRGLKRGEETFGIRMPLLVSLRKTDSVEHIYKTLDLALKYQLAGLDLSGDTNLGGYDHLIEPLLTAKKEGLKLMMHLGEVPQGDQRPLLELLQPDRVGHGVFLSAPSIEWLKETGTPLEVCLSTGYIAKMILSYEDHPGFKLYQEGHPVIFCTDDPLLTQKTLTDEIALAASLLGMSLEEIAAQQSELLANTYTDYPGIKI